MPQIIFQYKRVFGTYEAWTWKKNQTLIIGFQQEENARPMVIHMDDMRNMWPNAEARLVAERADEEDQPYFPANVAIDGNTMTWTPDLYDTENEGYGSCQVNIYDENDNIIAWSEKIRTLNQNSLAGRVDKQKVAWVQQMIQMRDDFILQASEQKGLMLEMGRLKTEELQEEGNTQRAIVLAQGNAQAQRIGAMIEQVSTSVEDARRYATDAHDAKSSASFSAGAAQEQAEKAASSARDAESSQLNAGMQAYMAQQSSTNASKSADDAKASAGMAGIHRTDAYKAADESRESAEDAKTSLLNAELAVSNAQSFAEEASSHAMSAEIHKNSALSAMQNAQAAQESAYMNATSAKNHADQATESAAAAKESQDKSAQSAASAQIHEEAAAASAAQAKDYADKVTAATLAEAEEYLKG